jgi:outer membrane protein TolC
VKSRRRRLAALAALAEIVAISALPAAIAASAGPATLAASAVPPSAAAPPVVRLAEAERQALLHNQAMAAAEAALRSVDEQIKRAGSPGSNTALGRKLTQTRAQLLAERQRMAVKFRTLFFHTLHDQRRLELRGRLARVAREAAGVTDQLWNVGAADRPDRLAIENEAQVLEAAAAAAQIELDELRTVLEATIGDPSLDLRHLDGDLVAEMPKIDREEWRQRLLRESPSLLGIRAEIAQQEEALARARRDPGATGTAAAEAALAQARLRAEQVRITIEVSFAETYGGYRSAARQVESYYGGVLARAERAYEETLHQYRQMTAAYPQVLIARRNLFQMEDAALDALQRAWSYAIDIQALLSYELPQNLAPPLAPAAPTQATPPPGGGASGHD